MAPTWATKQSHPASSGPTSSCLGSGFRVQGLGPPIDLYTSGKLETCRYICIYSRYIDEEVLQRLCIYARIDTRGDAPTYAAPSNQSDHIA